VKFVNDEVTLHASNVGLGKTIKKFNVLSIQEDRKMLA
jgi:hypothetical protein